MTDTIRDTVLNKGKDKYDAGVKEHGGQLGSSGLCLLDYLRMLQEEQIDQLMYIEAAIQEIEKNERP